MKEFRSNKISNHPNRERSKLFQRRKHGSNIEGTCGRFYFFSKSTSRAGLGRPRGAFGDLGRGMAELLYESNEKVGSRIPFWRPIWNPKSKKMWPCLFCIRNRRFFTVKTCTKTLHLLNIYYNLRIPIFRCNDSTISLPIVFHISVFAPCFRNVILISC